LALSQAVATIRDRAAYEFGNHRHGISVVLSSPGRLPPPASRPNQGGTMRQRSTILVLLSIWMIFFASPGGCAEGGTEAMFQ